MGGNSSAQLRVGSSAAMRVVSRGILRMRKGGTPLRRLDAALTRSSFYERQRTFSFAPIPSRYQRTPASTADGKPKRRAGFFIAENPEETWIARLKRNCEHFCACIDN